MLATPIEVLIPWHALRLLNNNVETPVVRAIATVVV